mmetsp:Transcript_89673/g.159297  ORF Transcript_89673/g.159297 Transcript_89673/m.159297 type:complete len:219 (+) Transcript_89673:1142-1798(+)
MLQQVPGSWLHEGHHPSSLLLLTCFVVQPTLPQAVQLPLSSCHLFSEPLVLLWNLLAFRVLFSFFLLFFTWYRCLVDLLLQLCGSYPLLSVITLALQLLQVFLHLQENLNAGLDFLGYNFHRLGLFLLFFLLFLPLSLRPRLCLDARHAVIVKDLVSGICSLCSCRSRVLSSRMMVSMMTSTLRGFTLRGGCLITGLCFSFLTSPFSFCWAVHLCVLA